MYSRLKLFFIFFALILTGYSGSLFIIGGLMQPALNETLEEIGGIVNENGFLLYFDGLDYKRGLWESQAVSTWKQGDDNEEINIHHQIKHGLFYTSVFSKLVDGGLRNRMLQVMEGDFDEPFTVETKISFLSSSSHSKFNFADFSASFENLHLVLHGFNGSFFIDKKIMNLDFFLNRFQGYFDYSKVFPGFNGLDFLHGLTISDLKSSATHQRENLLVSSSQLTAEKLDVDTVFGAVDLARSSFRSEVVLVDGKEYQMDLDVSFGSSDYIGFVRGANPQVTDLVYSLTMNFPKALAETLDAAQGDINKIDGYDLIGSFSQPARIYFNEVGGNYSKGLRRGYAGLSGSVELWLSEQEQSYLIGLYNDGFSPDAIIKKIIEKYLVGEMKFDVERYFLENRFAMPELDFLSSENDSYNAIIVLSFSRDGIAVNGVDFDFSFEYPDEIDNSSAHIDSADVSDDAVGSDNKADDIKRMIERDKSKGPAIDGYYLMVPDFDDQALVYIPEDSDFIIGDDFFKRPDIGVEGESEFLEGSAYATWDKGNIDGSDYYELVLVFYPDTDDMKKIPYVTSHSTFGKYPPSEIYIMGKNGYSIDLSIEEDVYLIDHFFGDGMHRALKSDKGAFLYSDGKLSIKAITSKDVCDRKVNYAYASVYNNEKSYVGRAGSSPGSHASCRIN